MKNIVNIIQKMKNMGIWIKTNNDLTNFHGLLELYYFREYSTPNITMLQWKSGQTKALWKCLPTTKMMRQKNKFFSSS
jgi:hypothetical protein